MKSRLKRAVKRMHHRNGVIAVEETFGGQKLHGRRRTWHHNGKIATEEFYRDGRLHGLCRQWNEHGKLLGSYWMEHGTGTQTSWYDNGRRNLEFTTIAGQFCGRSRFWLRDGTLISDEVLLFGRPATRDEYRLAMRQEPRLPKLRGWPAKLPPRNRAWQKRLQHVFVQGLLSKPNRSEARGWLQAGGKTKRLPGHFKRGSEALTFVEQLYQAGAVKVIVPDIYESKKGDQFADNLLVKLPKAAAARKAIRQVCQLLRKRKLGAVEPDEDLGEAYLLLSMA
jgi:hypothetical protein